MIGNDVVDLQLAAKQTRWNKTAFQRKVLHPIEIERHHGLISNFKKFWKIWCVKETAYKANQRILNHAPKINPACLLSEAVANNEFKVFTDSGTIYVNTRETEDFIYAFTTNDELISYQNFNLKNNEDCIFDINLNRQQLDKMLTKNKNRIPFVLKNNIQHPISITHHGRYFAYLKYKE